MEGMNEFYQRVLDVVGDEAVAEARSTAFVRFDRVALEFGDIAWEWEGVIPKGHLTMVVGQPGEGKSWFAASLIAAHLGICEYPGGARGNGEHVLLIETEGMRGVYAERMAAMGIALNRVLSPRSNDREIPDAFYVPDLMAELSHIAEGCAQEGITMLVIDSLSGGHSMDENDSKVRALLGGLSRMAAALRIGVVLVHHTRKRNAFEAAQVTLDRIRGSSVFAQYCRSILGLWRPNNGTIVRVDCIKSNFSKPFAPFGFVIGENSIVFTEAPEEARDEKPIDRACEFLRRRLRDGGVGARELREEADAEGISKVTLWRAKKVVGVVVRDGAWTVMDPKNWTHS